MLGFHPFDCPDQRSDGTRSPPLRSKTPSPQGPKGPPPKLVFVEGTGGSPGSDVYEVPCADVGSVSRSS